MNTEKWLEKKTNGNGGGIRKSPITEFEAAREQILHEAIAQVTGHCRFFHDPQLPSDKKPLNAFRFQMCKRWAFMIDAPFKISSNCCKIMKKDVSKKYAKETGRHPIIGTLAEESMMRKVAWLKTGCNAFNSVEPKSTPMAFWTEQDVLSYIKRMSIPISPIYGEVVETSDGKLKTTGAQRTGCMYCLFGINHEKQPNRIQRLYYTHPKIYHYILDKLGFRDVMDFMGVPYEPVIDRQLKLDL